MSYAPPMGMPATVKLMYPVLDAQATDWHELLTEQRNWRNNHKEAVR